MSYADLRNMPTVVAMALSCNRRRPPTPRRQTRRPPATPSPPPRSKHAHIRTGARPQVIHNPDGRAPTTFRVTRVSLRIGGSAISPTSFVRFRQVREKLQTSSSSNSVSSADNAQLRHHKCRIFPITLCSIIFRRVAGSTTSRPLGFQSLPWSPSNGRRGPAGSRLVSEPAGQVGGRARRHSLWTSQPSTTSTNAMIPVG
jgi:hypothetical protein